MNEKRFLFNAVLISAVFLLTLIIFLKNEKIEQYEFQLTQKDYLIKELKANNDELTFNNNQLSNNK